MGLALLAKGATDVASYGGAILEEVLHLSPMGWVGGLECLHNLSGHTPSP
jgi:hypothetical protein